MENLDRPKNEGWPEADLTLDGGEAGCGELLIEMWLAIRKLPEGGLMALITVDPGAPEDIPAWCRMTGHSLLGHRPLDGRRTTYFIRKGVSS